ncbi:hypothetical protein Xcc1_20700 [Xanthomonas campestris pv. campestris]|uniref:hypothetical protein n=1 Tax=Xanthomonas campestris TaxID=339 RepID=UPI000370BD43|nr:hypothetical protein [Xanthomonas campestris]BBJ96340.1 hypothetical protein Xcc1_20700 [Xanthomonas campestris pv. campestris]
MVRSLCAVTSWEALDAYWLPQIDTGYPSEADSEDLRGRRRIFESIDRYGHDPSSLRGLNGRYLIEVVHADRRMEDLKQMFASRLWNRLSDMPGTPADMKADWNHLIERWGSPQFRSLFKAMSRLLHAQRMSIRDVRLLVEHAPSLDSLVLLSCVRERGRHSDGPNRRARYEAAVWFFLHCFLRRWCAYWCTALVHLIATRLIDKDPGPWLEHERTSGGFPVRQQPKRARYAADPAAVAAAHRLPCAPSELRTRLQTGFLATCTRLAASTGGIRPQRDARAGLDPAQALCWLVELQPPPPLQRPALSRPIPQIDEASIGRFPARLRPRRSRPSTLAISMSAQRSLPAWQAQGDRVS